MVVPEEHHALGQRRGGVAHFLQPPGAQRHHIGAQLAQRFLARLDVGLGPQRRADRLAREGRRRLPRLRAPCTGEQPIDRFLWRQAHPRRDLGG